MNRNALFGAVLVSAGLLITHGANAEIINVPGDYPAIQEAINAAFDGDEIVVGPGTWNGSLNLIGKEITVRSSDGPEETFLTTTDSLRVIYCVSGETEFTVIEGFTITGDPGGGMYIQLASPTLRDCIFDSCWAGIVFAAAAVDITGGGPRFEACVFQNSGSTHHSLNRVVRIAASTPEFIDCTFDSNRIANNSAGVAVVHVTTSVPVFRGCVFTRNHDDSTATPGGPEHLIQFTHFTVATMESCLVLDNEVRHIRVETDSELYVSSQSEFVGNGFNHDNPDTGTPAHQPILSADWSSRLEVSDCSFTGNYSFPDKPYSPLVFSGSAHWKLADCTFSGNAPQSVIYVGGDPENEGPHIVRCTFRENSARSLYANGECVIEGTTFANNESATHSGLAIYTTDPLTLRDCLFEGNYTEFGTGGAIWCDDRLTMSNCILRDNFAILGSAIYLASNAADDSYICNSRISGNIGGASGGLYCKNASPTVVNVLFDQNLAASWGGAVFGFGNANPLLVNCTITENTALGGAAVYGLDVSAQSTLRNCIVSNNTNAGGYDDIDGPGIATVTYSNVEGGYNGEGNIDAEPMFADAGAGDYHLLAGSPSIDAGNNNDLPEDVADLDGDGDTSEPITLDLDLDPRIVNDTVDMGCYEFDSADDLCPADIDGSGDVGFTDLVEVLTWWGPCVSCLEDLDGDGIVGFIDLVFILANWGPCPE